MLWGKIVKKLGHEERLRTWGVRGVFAALFLCALFPLLSHVYIEIFGDFFISNLPDPFKALSTWSEDNFGANSVIGTWRFFPLGLIYYFFGTISKIPLQFVQFMVIGSLFLAAAYGFIKLTRVVFNIKRDQEPFVYVGALLYVFNPFVLTQLVNSYVQAIPHLLMPIAVLLLIRIMQDKSRIRNLFLLAAINALVFAVNLVFGAIYFCLFISYGLWQIIKTKQWHFWSFVRQISITFIITILLSAWWLAPLVVTNLLDADTAQYVLNSETFYNKETSVSQVLRQLGDWGFFGSHAGTPFFSFAKGYRNNPIVIVAGYSITLLVIMAFLNFRNNSKRIRSAVLYFGLAIAILLPVIGGTNPNWPTSGLMRRLFELVPYSNIFRNTYKWTSILIMAMAMLLIAFLLGMRQKHRKLTVGLALFACVVIVLYAFPFFTNGAFPHSRIYNGLPHGWQQATTELTESKEPGMQRLLLLPDQYFSVYKWEDKRKGFRHLEPDVFDVPIVRNTCAGCGQVNTAKLLGFIYDHLADKNIFKLAGAAGVSHLLQRNDFDYEYYNVESPEKIKSILSAQPEISAERSFDQLDLYKIDSNLVNKILYSPHQVISSQELNDFLPAFDNFEDFGQGTSFALTKQSNEQTLLESNYFQPLFSRVSGVNQGRVVDQATVPNTGDYTITRKDRGESKYRLFYASDSGSYKITIQQLPEDLWLGDQAIYSNEKTGSKEIDLGVTTTRAIVLEIGDQSYYLETGKQKESLGSISLTAAGSTIPINIYETNNEKSENLLINGSFEEGPWRDKVENCDLRTNNADISLFMAKDATDGSSSLGLNARNDTACMFSTGIKDFKSDAVYLLSFDAKNIAGTAPAFCVWDGSGCSRYQRISSSNQWQTYHSSVKLGADAVIFQLYLYSHKGNNSETTNLYDNIKVHRLDKKLSTLQLPLPTEELPASFQTNLRAGSHDMSTSVVKADINLIENGSFEKELWANGKVSNCREYGANPQLQMKREEDAVDGRYSLELYASRETACVASEVLSHFNKDQIYSVSFDYKIVEGQEAQLCVWDGKTCILNQKVKADLNKWQHFESIVRPTAKSQFISIYLYAPGGKSSSRVRYDNISLQTIENLINKYTLKTADLKTIEPAQIMSYERQGPTKFKAKIKLTSSKSLLVFQQSYHRGWRAYIKPPNSSQSWRQFLLTDDGYRIDPDDHIIANGFANGWWIDSNNIPESLKNDAGEYELILEYWPQRWLYTGSFITGFTLIGIVGWWALKKKLMSNKNNNYRLFTSSRHD